MCAKRSGSDEYIVLTQKAQPVGTGDQTDWIALKRRFRNSIKQVKTFRGADVNSDQVPVIATIRLKLERAMQQR